ncbi:hypothetical protein HDV00_012207 [Rhizophlyctis rosea]|nr:hypothetical protein HDV00_012207 [Rhizophlyctis rosea]
MVIMSASSSYDPVPSIVVSVYPSPPSPSSPRPPRRKRNVSPQAFVGSYSSLHNGGSSSSSDAADEFAEEDMHWHDHKHQHQTQPIREEEEEYESGDEHQDGDGDGAGPGISASEMRGKMTMRQPLDPAQRLYHTLTPKNSVPPRFISQSHPIEPTVAQSWVNSYTRTMTCLSFDTTISFPSPRPQLPTHRQDLIPKQPSETTHLLTPHPIDPHQPKVIEGTSSVPSSIFNTLNLLIGIGFLSLPYAIRCAGWVPGLAIVIFTALITNVTGHLLAKCLDACTKLGLPAISYGDLGEAAYGPRARTLVSVVFLTELVFTCVAFVILIEDSLKAIFPGVGVEWFRGVAFLICVGASLVKNLTWISYASLVGIVGSLNLIAVILYNGTTTAHAPGSISDPMPTHMFPDNPASISLAIGIVMAGFAGHAVLPNIYLDMKDKSRYPFVLNVSFGIALVLYLTVAVVGYLMFGNETLQEITMNIAALPGANQMLNVVATWLICFIPVPKYALTIAPVSQTADAFLARYFSSASSSTSISALSADPHSHSPSPMGATSAPTMARYILTRVALVLLTALVPFLLPHFDTVLALIGCIFTVAVSVVMPAAFYARLNAVGEDGVWKKRWCYGLVGAGVVVGVGAMIGMAVPGARPIKPPATTAKRAGGPPPTLRDLVARELIPHAFFTFEHATAATATPEMLIEAFKTTAEVIQQHAPQAFQLSTVWNLYLPLERIICEARTNNRMDPVLKALHSLPKPILKHLIPSPYTLIHKYISCWARRDEQHSTRHSGYQSRFEMLEPVLERVEPIHILADLPVVITSEQYVELMRKLRVHAPVDKDPRCWGCVRPWVEAARIVTRAAVRGPRKEVLRLLLLVRLRARGGGGVRDDVRRSILVRCEEDVFRVIWDWCKTDEVEVEMLEKYGFAGLAPRNPFKLFVDRLML